MKKCSICDVTKSLSDFPKRKDSKDGYRGECKDCKSKRDSTRHVERMSDPTEKEKESLRLKAIHDSRTPEQISENRAKQVNRARRLAEKDRQKFFDEFGCTRQELKWKKDGEEFIKRSLARNGDAYRYHAVEYRGVWNEVKIWCNTHNKFFNQTPKSHNVGSGCIECGKIATGNALRKSQEDFIKDVVAIHGDKFSFDKVVYVANGVEVILTCKEHGDFTIRPGNLLSGKGCRSCAEYGYRPSKGGNLYVLKDNDTSKIGITNNPVTARVRQINKSSGKDFKIISEHYFEDGSIPVKLEKELLAELRSEYKQPCAVYDGSTESFEFVDVEQLLSRVSQKISEVTA